MVSLRPVASAAGMAAPVAMSAFSENTPSIDLSASSLAWISASLLEMSARPADSWRFSTLPKVCLAPSQRCWRPMLFASWMGQSSLVTPSSLNFLPASWPAISSSCPTWVIAPRSWNTALPEFSVTIGMPAAVALESASLMASGLGADTAMPVQPAETPASISCACFCGSLLDSW